MHTFKEHMHGRVFLIANLTNGRVVDTAARIEVSPTGKQKGEQESRLFRMRIEKKGYDSELLLQLDELGAASGWNVAVKVEAVLRKNHPVLLSLVDKISTCLEDFKLKSPPANL
jgi:hypothetical protein